MPQISKRATQMPESPIRKLAPYALEAVERGVDVMHLNIGQPDIPSPPEFWEAIRGDTRELLEYSPSQGMGALQQGMAAHYTERGIGVSPDQVLITTGGSEALSFTIATCLNPGDEVIVPEPLYANYIGFTRGQDVNVVPLETRIEDDFALPPVEAFREACTDRTRAVLICNPNNPTGAIYTQEQIEGIRDLALERDLFVISDEVYRVFNYTGRPSPSILEVEGLEERAIMIDSSSKKYSLCGARIGFIVTRNKEVLRHALRFAQARLAPPTLEQVGLLGALRAPDSYFDGVRAEYMSRRDLLAERVCRIPGAICPRIDGAFYAMVRLPIDDSDAFAKWLLAEFSYEGKTVMLAPGTGFYSTPGKGLDEVRLAYVLGRERLDQALDCLEAALGAYPGAMHRKPDASARENHIVHRQ